MAKVIRDVEAINSWVEEKQQLEVMLAWDLLERFNSAAMIQPLRTMANAAINKMIEMPKDKVDSAILDERGKHVQYLTNQLVLSARPGGPPTVLTISSQSDLQAIWQRNAMPDAQYCSDIIRLFGSCVEQFKGMPGELGQLDATRQEYRDKGSAGHSPWADGKTPNDPTTFGRWRGKASFAPVPGGTDVGLLNPEERAEKQRKFDQEVDPKLLLAQRAQKQIEDATISKVQRFLIYQQGGQSVIALKDQSTVARINRVFGTVPASDISGTTADTLFFFDQMKGSLVEGLLDPVYYLLPAATIVAGAHHSLLEVALALSLKNDMTNIDYHIGFYKTLLPATINRGEILKSLEAAENHKYNHHMLIFYEGPNKIDGCFKFEYGEIEKFRRFGKVTDVEQRFRNIPAWPSEEVIRKTWPATYFF